MTDRLLNDAAWDQYEATLRFVYGAERAEQILDGRDPAHQQDLASWLRLGRRLKPAARLVRPS